MRGNTPENEGRRENLGITLHFFINHKKHTHVYFDKKHII